MDGFMLLLGHLLGDYVLQNDWQAQNKTTRSLHCTVHCLLYTAAVWACSFWWMPWWGVAACFALHWPVDRFRLARRWMKLTGQEQFATGVFSPWSIIVVDNVGHLVVLAGIAAAAGRVGS